MRSHLLLTGATGLIGRYLLLELLERGVPLAVVVRPQREKSGRERIEAIVRELEQTAGTALPRPVCLEGEVSAAGLGMNRESRDWVARHCGRLLHNAASVTFDGADRTQEPWRTNLLGTQQVLTFMQDSGMRDLHWVSTAYVCGNRTSRIQEDDLDCGQPFRNDYERSKCAAELMVRRAGFLDSLTVYRPSIVVGDSQTGYTNSYHNIYLFLQFTHILSQGAERDAAGRWHHPVRLAFSGEEELNLVPVDWVGAAIAHLVQTPGCQGRTYHLTHPQPTTCGQMEQALARYFNYYGVRFVGTEGIPPGEANELEQMFYASLAAHDSYWLQHPKFDCRHALAALAHLPCPTIDVEYLLRLFEFAVRHRFGKRPRSRTTSAPASLAG